VELLSANFEARGASLTKSFIGGHDIIKVGVKKFNLPGDISKTKVTMEQNEMTGVRALLIILLAITIIGLLLAIPLYFSGKRKRMNMAFKAKTGEIFTIAVSSNKEWKILKRYAGLGEFE